MVVGSWMRDYLCLDDLLLFESCVELLLEL
jgi:hypothetical protein